MAGRWARVGVALVLAGCATGKPVVWTEEGVSLSSYRTVRVGEVANATGQASADPVAQALTRGIRDRLREQGIHLSDDANGGDATLVFESRLDLYAPGNAFSRWVTPGEGTTQCRVVGDLLDGRTHDQLGVVLSDRAVSGGGLLSAGADSRIVEVVASDIADGIARELMSR